MEDFQTQVLTRLAVIESKLDGYKEVKKITYDTSERSRKNEEEIKELKNRVDKIEEKPVKRYDGIVNQVLTFVIEAILIIVAMKIGLKK